MKKNNVRMICLAITALLVSSCSHRVLDFTLISSKNVDLSRGATFVKGKNRVEGKDMVHWIIIVPTGTVSIKEAVDRAIESTPGCVALMDGVIYSKFWFIPYIYGQQSATVEGTPLIDPGLVNNATEIPTYRKIEFDKKGSVAMVESITNTEYYALKNKIVKESKIKNVIKNDDIE